MPFSKRSTGLSTISDVLHTVSVENFEGLKFRGFELWFGS